MTDQYRPPAPPPTRKPPDPAPRRRPRLVDGTAVRFPNLTSASGTRWATATVGGVLAVGVYLYITDPANRWYGVGFYLFYALFLTAGIWQSSWLEPGTGTFVRVHWRCWRRSVQLGPSTEFTLVSTRKAALGLTGNGILLLAARPAGSRYRMYLPVLSLTQYVERSMHPALLRLLADTLVTQRTAVEPGLVELLRAQADHIEAGGTPDTSPLAPHLNPALAR
ncbi:MAG TPA: hypothetical protein VGC67_07195 [Cellulomonas sp.]